MPEVVLNRAHRGLWINTERDHVDVVFTALADEPTVRFASVNRRLRTYLVLLDGKHLVDLSGQPSAVARIIDDGAVDADQPAPHWHAALVELAVASATQWGIAVPGLDATEPPRERLKLIIGGARYPMLAAAYDGGAATEREVPRWARRGLDADSARDMATALMGAKASRSVVRAIGRWVTEPEAGALAWKPLAMATAGAAVLAPDDIAAVVVADGPTMRAAPSVDDVTLFAWTARFLGRVRYRRLAVNAIAAQDREKVTRVLRLLKIVQRGIVHPVPTELDELERACLAVVQIAPPPAEPAAPPPPRPRPAAPAAPPTPPPVRPVWDRAVRPPVANATDPRRTTFTYSAAVSALHGLVLGELELCLPRGATELTTWGRVLRNCLGDFVTAVGTGRSVVVGVRDRGHLIGALEFHPGAHTLIQFVGVRNRSVGDAVATPVIEELERRGLISPQARSARCSP